MTVRFVAIGDVLVDVAVSGSDHDAHARLALGGASTNAALAATNAGANAVLIGRVGDDPAGRMLRSELEARCVRPSLTIDPDRPTGTYLVVDGEVRVDRGANAGFLPEHLPQTLEADVTLVSGHLPEETASAALERSQAHWNALAAARLERLPEGGNAVVVNEVEAQRLTGAPPEEAARLLGERFRLACVTLGADGAIGVLDGSFEHARPEQLVAVGGIGAGDAFAAAALVALASGVALREALVAGCRAGTLALSTPK